MKAYAKGRLGWRLEVAEKIFQKNLKNPLTNARASAIIQTEREKEIKKWLL